MDNFKVKLKGDDGYFPVNIEFPELLVREMPIGYINMKLIKNNKLLPKNSSLYIYLILPSDMCGFIPLPNQTLGELFNLYGNNKEITLKISHRADFG